jgi:hypothetical protein
MRVIEKTGERVVPGGDDVVDASSAEASAA